MSALPAAEQARRRRARLSVRFGLLMVPAMTGSNTLGALVVFVYLSFLSPMRPTADDPTGVVVNGIVFVGYLGLAVLVGVLGSLFVLLRPRRWLGSGEQVSREDRAATLRLPGRLVRVYGGLWLVGVPVFTGLNLDDSLGNALQLGVTVALGGAVTCTLSYLLAERLVRPLVAEAMRDTSEPPPVVLGVRRRVLLAWGLGTGVPLAGIFAGTLDLDRSGRLGVGALLFLSAVGLFVGLLAMLFAARSIADPVQSVTSALREVAAGRLDVGVAVYDGSEVGQLQSGFNEMVSGLRDRDRLADLFGRQVGVDVARLAVEQGVRLGGVRREVAVLFVDVVGSTALTQEHGPEEVVARLNAFFGVVVDVVTAAGGWVNKFEGDAALCVFGAPSPLPDPCSAALRAARRLRDGLAPLPLSAAVGVCAGPVVAGHVGAESRFEYTVVGDPVNMAARLTELAKAEPGRVLADAALLARADPQEAARWQPAGEVVLRGRTGQTALARPT